MMKVSTGQSVLIIVVLITISCWKSEADTGEYLESLGKSLARRLSQPGQESETLLRDLFDYYNHLKEIHDNITTTTDEQLRKEGFDIVQELIEDGGPPHLNIQIDFDQFLFKVFKNDQNVKAINDVLKYNRETWNKLKLLYEKHAHI